LYPSSAEKKKKECFQLAGTGFHQAIRIINRGCRWKADFEVFCIFLVDFLASMLGLALMVGVLALIQDLLQRKYLSLPFRLLYD